MDDDIARELVFQGVIDACRDMSRRSRGGASQDEGGVALFASAHSLPVLLNGVARMDPATTPAEVLERARAYFAPRGCGFTVYGIGGRDDDLLAAAEAMGLLEFSEPAPMMTLDEPPAQVDLPSGVTMAPVVDVAGVMSLAEVCADAYAVYGMPADAVDAVYDPPSLLLAPHIAAVLASDEAGPVATATAVATHGTTYLQWVATRQRAFGRGLGAAVTQAVTVAGFETGARLATLFASPMGAPVYRRLGWADVGLLHTRTALSPLG